MNKTSLILLSVILLGSGCASRRVNVPFKITSDPSDCPIEVNGVQSGKTPTSLTLSFSKGWVGVVNAPGGWAVDNPQYIVECFPPKGSIERLVSQTKIITPNMTPSGANIHFDLSLRPVRPTQPIEIKQIRGKDDFRQEGLTSTSQSVHSKMKQLKAMLDEGLISEDEYNVKRIELLDEL